MKIRDLLGFSIRNLWKRKLRTSLTILGVIIGAASIVIMLSLGIAMNENFNKQIGQMGSLNTITVYRSYNFDPNIKDKDRVIINDQAILEFENIPGVEIATPIIELQLKLASGNYLNWLSVRGIKPEMLKIQNVKLEEGRLLENEDKMSFIFGAGIKYGFYNPKSNNQGMMYGGYGEDFESPVDLMNDSLKVSYDMNFGEKPMPGQEVSKRVRPIKITAIGLFQEGQWEQEYSAYTTLEQAKKLKEEKEKYEASLNPDSPKDKKKVDEGYDMAYVHVTKMDDVKRVQDQIKDMGFETNSLMEYLESMKKMSANIQAVLGGIGAVSLLVAALGITNTMIMSIYERTKEIGVMKVIGASLPDIKKMFLTEAAMIGFFGGLLGLLVSFLGSLLLNYVGKDLNMFGGGMGDDKLSVIPIWLYLLSVTFTTLVGVISGYLPAIKAMKLSVLKALRTE